MSWPKNPSFTFALLPRQRNDAIGIPTRNRRQRRVLFYPENDGFSCPPSRPPSVAKVMPFTWRPHRLSAVSPKHLDCEFLESFSRWESPVVGRLSRTEGIHQEETTFNLGKVSDENIRWPANIRRCRSSLFSHPWRIHPTSLRTRVFSSNCAIRFAARCVRVNASHQTFMFLYRCTCSDTSRLLGRHPREPSISSSGGRNRDRVNVLKETRFSFLIPTSLPSSRLLALPRSLLYASHVHVVSCGKPVWSGWPPS